MKHNYSDRSVEIQNLQFEIKLINVKFIFDG